MPLGRWGGPWMSGERPVMSGGRPGVSGGERPGMSGERPGMSGGWCCQGSGRGSQGSGRGLSGERPGMPGGWPGMLGCISEGSPLCGPIVFFNRIRVCRPCLGEEWPIQQKNSHTQTTRHFLLLIPLPPAHPPHPPLFCALTPRTRARRVRQPWFCTTRASA